MTFKFKKIYATDPIFQDIRKRNQSDYDFFKGYANDLTASSGKADNNTSGKASSYANYLIRFVYLYEEYYNIQLTNLLSFKTLIEIEKVLKSKNFREYNQTENYFPSATFNCYISCVTYLNSKQVNQRRANDAMKTMKYSHREPNYVNLIDNARTRENKIKSEETLVYPRKTEESLEAKRRSNWMCELNSNHQTFINKTDEKPYMEAHHLIPMSAQDYFKNTLDFADNIVCLCPNCHRMIHHATNDVKNEILRVLYESRENRYQRYGIRINFQKLLNFYGIF